MLAHPKKRIWKFFADIRSVPAQIVLLLHISDASRTNNFHHLLPARVEDFFVCYHFLAKLKILLFKYNYPPLFDLFIPSDQWHHFLIRWNPVNVFQHCSSLIPWFFCVLDFIGVLPFSWVSLLVADISGCTQALVPPFRPLIIFNIFKCNILNILLYFQLQYNIL